MMKKSIFAGMMSMLMVVLLPVSSASAESIRDVSIDSTGDDIAIAFETRGPVLAPQIRTSPGNVSLTFGATLDRRSRTFEGDGTFIQRIEMMAGGGQFSSAHIAIRRGLTLPATRVRIETRDDGVIVRIAKNVLTPLSRREQRAAQADETAEPSENAATTATTTVAAVPATQTVTQAAATTEVAPAPAARAAAAPRATTRNNAFSAAIPASAAPSVPVILFITLLLAAGYFGLRLILQKRGGQVAPAIDVIASKRIGARHQLIIVRAFGRDHLLSVQGNSTQRIATTKSPTVALTKMAQAAAVEETPRIKRLQELRDDDGALRLADLRLSSRYTMPPPADDVEPVRNGYGQARRNSMAPESMAPAPNSEIRTKISLQEETRFGAELMKLVRASVAPPAQSARPIEDATSGIVRLRKQAAR